MSREVIWVTPAMAREWLTKTTQRWGSAPRTPVKVDKFAAAMLRGEWDPHRKDVRPVEVIAGRLEQGHHRLHAVAKANIPVRMPVSTTRTTRRGQQMIRLYHPTLRVHHTVATAKVAELYKRSGWVDAQEKVRVRTPDEEVSTTEDVGGDVDEPVAPLSDTDE